MYSIEINFLKDRTEPSPSAAAKIKKKPLSAADLLPLFAGVGVGLLFLGLAGGGYAYVQWKTNETQAAIDSQNTELQRLQTEQQKIDSLKAKIEIARSQVNGLTSIFGQIKSWSALLKDILDRIPERVQIEAIKQLENPQAAAAPASPAQGQPPAQGQAPAATTAPPIILGIAGIADSYQPINDLLLVLKNSKFLNPEETRLVKAELIDSTITVEQKGNAQVEIELPKVVEYEIRTQLNSIPEPELLRLLENKGAAGLATRLRAAEAVGAAQEPIVENQPQAEQTGEAQQ